MLKEFIWCIDAGATQDTELRTNAVKFGDGYEQVSSIGINNATVSWSVSKTGRLSDVEQIYDFLLEHKGVAPFLMTINSLPSAYRVEGNISKIQVSGDVWSISFAVKQVFLP